MHAHSHSYPHPIDHDEEDEATIVCPSPYLAMIADQAEADARAGQAEEFGHAESGVVPASRTELAKGYPSTPEPVHHTFTEPLRGYPQSAAYVPRHEETEVFVTFFEPAPTVAAPWTAHDAEATIPPTTAMPAVQAGGSSYAPAAASVHSAAPATLAMPAVQPASAAAPSYGPNVVALPSHANEGRTPLVADGGAVSYAPDGRNAPLFTAPAPTPVPPANTSQAKELRVGRALFGALLGAIAGAVLWGAVGFLTGGYEFKYGAVLIGLFTGAGASRFGGGHSKGVGALGAIFGLAGILTGKALFEILVQPHLTLGQHIAYHATVIDLVFYAATIVTGFAVGAGILAPRTIVRRGRYFLRRFVPSIG